MDFEDEDIFGMASGKKDEGWGQDVNLNKIIPDNSLDAALNLILDEEKREKKIKKYETVIVRPKRENDPASSKLTIIQHLEETDYSLPTDNANLRFADDVTADQDIRFKCVKCRLEFNSLQSKLPFSLPCSHNVCSDCASTAQANEFTCPRDQYFLGSTTDLKMNENLFREVKLRERRLKRENDED